jgi:N-acyl homoserine lactone hydrolase
MDLWDVKVLYYGKITLPKSALTPNLDPNLPIDLPYLGFLLTNGKRKVLVDTGISDTYIVDGKAWGGYPAQAGRAYLERALKDANVDPLEIETILFTHLHNDHAANTTLFKNAQLIFQRDEWKTLLDPLPVMNVRKDYDPALVAELKTMNCVKVDGDFEFADGIKVYKTPGHTAGSMSIAVRTQKGLQVLAGDQFIISCMAFSKQTEMMDMQGKRHKITPPPDVLGPFIPSALVYDYYDYYDSGYKIMSIAGECKPGFIIPGHEPSLIVTGV